MSSLRYTLDARRPESRTLHVRLQFERQTWTPGSEQARRILFAAVWTPGSYLVREFARQFGPVTASDLDSGAAIACSKVAKNRYLLLLPEGTGRIEVTYCVYAHELTVRTADLTTEHAFWNHANVLLWPLDQPGLRAEIEVLAPVGWQTACSLPRVAGTAAAPIFEANGIDAAFDAPCLLGRFEELHWQAGGVAHHALLDGLAGARPPASLLDDLRAVSEQAIAVFGHTPYRDYTFQCMFTDGGRGGLEHRDSSVLLADRAAMRGGKSYQEFLGLAAHELFHAWNVKRMRPAELWSFDYEAENYTRMLWLAEGFTAYYDDLLCQRAGVSSVDDYLAILARNLATMTASSGRLKQSLEESSYDAWIRFYRPDENTRNSTQNYYVNGALVGTFWDLTIRRASRGERSLDDFMRALWQRTFAAGRGYGMGDVEACLVEVLAGDGATALQLLELVRGPLDLQFAPLLEAFGLRLVPKEPDKPFLGVGFKEGGTVVAYVNDDSPAFAAGVAPGDEVLAVDGLRVTQDNWSIIFQTVAAIGRELRMLVASRGVVRELRVTPISAPAAAIVVERLPEASAEAVALRDGWLRTDAAKPAG